MTAMMLDDIEPSDLDLIGQAQKGDSVAFGRLVERHYDFVYRVAWRWSGRKADAEDIAQEVCARLGRAIRGYRGGGAFTTWLYAMTMNAARDLMRKSARETAKSEAFGLHALVEGQSAPDDRAEKNSGRRCESCRTSSATRCCSSMAKGSATRPRPMRWPARRRRSRGTSMKRRNG